MRVTVGGATAMNIHGKNHYRVGSFGEHVRSFTWWTPGRGEQTVSRESDPELFHAAIGSFGVLGRFSEVELQLARVASGSLRVSAIVTESLEDNLERIDAMRDEAGYLVSWLDMHARGAALGRGLLHRADHVAADEAGAAPLDAKAQEVRWRLLGLVPPGWRVAGNLAGGEGGRGSASSTRRSSGAGASEAAASPYLQSHGAFHFLLDWVPHWDRAFRPGGLIQFQPFLPVESAAATLREIGERCQRAGAVPYLGVLKRHRPDPFLMSYVVDGFSLALDFPVPSSPRRRERLFDLTRELADLVLDAGGRFYYAKDATLPASAFERIHGADAVARFRAWKRELDPEGLLQTDLAERLMGPEPRERD